MQLYASSTRGKVTLHTTVYENKDREVKPLPAVSVSELQREPSKYGKHAVSTHMTFYQQIITELCGI